MRTRSDGVAEKPGRGRPKRRRSSASVEDTKPTTTEDQHDLNHAVEAPPSSSQPSLDTQKVRRKKRVKEASLEVTVQPSTELNDTNQNSHAVATMSDEEIIANDDDDEVVGISEHRSKRVRFSDPGRLIGQVPSPADAAVTGSTGFSPDSQTVSLPQADTPHPVKSRNAGRLSLPAAFSSSPEGGVQQLQFSPLRAVLDERMRRRLRRSHLSEEVNEIEEHKREDARTRHELDKLRSEVGKRDERVKQLMLELELQRQLGIEVIGEKDEEDEKVREMEEELARLRKEIAEAHSRDTFSPGLDAGAANDADEKMDDVDDNGLVLVNPSDIDIVSEETKSQSHIKLNGIGYHSRPSSAITALLVSPTEASTQVSLPDPIEETERLEFEKAIATLTRQASDAKAALQILSIELQSLGFARADATPEAVLSSIRAAFYHARTELEELLPGDTPGSVENGALLKLLIEHIRRLLETVGEQTVALESHETLEKVLRTQLGGLLDKLADVDHRKHLLESQWRELDVEAERKEKDIIELNSQLDILESESQERVLAMNQKDEKILEMEEELENQAKSIDRLQLALQGYRDEVSGLEALVVKIGEQHKESLAQLENSHTETVAELQEKIQLETSYRETADAEIDEKTSRITALELELEAAATSLDELRSDLADTEAIAETERQLRETAETTLAIKSTTIELLETKVSAAEASLDSLTTELSSLRTLAASERHQRQAAETLLDERDTQLAALEGKLHEAGTTANLLRDKLFEIQQAREREIAELQNEATERENQYQNDIAAEIERREEAERDEASTREAMEELEESARVTEQTLRGEVAAREERLAQYKRELADTEVALKEANLEAAAAKDQYDRVILGLQNDVADRDSLIETRDTELEEERRTAAQTAAELATARDTIARLEDVRTSLERRIEAEAEELLASEERHAAAEEALRSEIAGAKALNDQLRTEIHEREHALQHTVREKDLEIEALKDLVASREDKLTIVTDQAQMLRAVLRDRVAKEKIEMGRIAEGMHEVAARISTQAQDFVAEGTEVLKAVGADVDADVGAVINGNHSEKIVHEHKSLRSEIGFGPNGMAEEQAAEVTVAVASVEKRGSKKVTSKKRRSRRREFDSGIGVAPEEEADDGPEMEELGWV